MLNKIERKLDELLVTKAPYQLPASFKSSLVTAMPWLVLVGGILSLWSAWTLYQILTWTNSWMGWGNGVNTYSVGYPFGGNTSFMWLNLIILAAEAVLFLLAFSHLREHKKKGWNLLFIVALLNVLNAVFYLLVNGQIVTFLITLAGSVFGLYLLFQIKSAYTERAAKKTATRTTKKK